MIPDSPWENVISRLPPASCLAIDGFAFETKPLLIVLRRDNSPSQAVTRVPAGFLNKLQVMNYTKDSRARPTMNGFGHERVERRSLRLKIKQDLRQPTAKKRPQRRRQSVNRGFGIASRN
jgi:hypothetical protein